MPLKTQLPPHLVELQGKKCCSVCKLPFDANAKPSRSAAFKLHVLLVHRTKP